MRRSLSLAALLTIAATATACGGPPAAATPGASGPASSALPVGGATVIILNFTFDPPVVNARVGAPVTWRNTDAAAHSVKWDDGTPASSNLGTGNTYSRTFDRAGRFTYVCGIHSNMTGAVSVE